MDPATIQWKEFLHEVYNWPYFWPTVIAIFILLLIERAICKRRKVIKLSSNEEGKISVMRSALINLIENACNDVAPDSKPAFASTKNGKLNLKIKIQVFADQHVENTTSIIQKQVGYVLQDTLGLENIGTINILIANFRKSHNKTTSINTPTYSETEMEN